MAGKSSSTSTDPTVTIDSDVSAPDAGPVEDAIGKYTSPWFDYTPSIVTSNSQAAVGEGVGLSAPAMQRYTDEELRDCPIEECVTAQWDTGMPLHGSFEDAPLGSHFFDLEPKNFDGEPGNETIKIKKFPSSSAAVETVATCEHLTIVTILDEGIGPNSEWCKIKIADLQRSTDFYNAEGYVKRNTLRRLESGTKCWEGSSTLPSPPYVRHRNRVKPNWNLGVPWYTMLACEPWLDEKELRYKTMVNTGHKNREVMDMLMDQAKRIGIKQMMVYYDRLPSGYDVTTLDNGVAHLTDNLYQFAKVEKTYISDKPNTTVKALVSINMSHMLAVPRMVRKFTTASEVRTGYRTVMYQSNTFESKIAKICSTMEMLQPHVDMFQGIIRGSQPYSPTKWAEEIRKFPSALKKLFRANDYTLRKDHEDIIEIATDGDFNPTHVIVYPDDTGIGVPQTIGFNNFASQAPVNSARLMHYILKGNDMFSEAKLPAMSTLTPPWRKYLTNFTYPPLEIRPTPPSGLGKMPELPNIANQFNKLNIKGPGDIAFENMKLNDPNFLGSMAAARFDAVTIAGDNILGNLPVVLDKINSLDDVYAELLQKISIPKLIELAMAKVMSELGLDDIYGALLKAALSEFSVDALIKQFMMQLPEDLLTDLLTQLMDKVDLSCDDLIDLIVSFGITTSHLSAIADQVAGEVDALREHVDTFNSLMPGMCDTTGATVDTSLDEDLQEQAASIENAVEDILANLTCDDLKLIVKNIATMGVPDFTFEPPSIDLSCFVKDIELQMGNVLMPFIKILTGFPLDVTRLGEIDWSGLQPTAPNINIMTPDGFVNISSWEDDFDALSDLPGFSMPQGGFSPALAAPELNFPQFALGGLDASTGDLTASPGGIQFPNIKFADAFSDLEIPGGVETLVTAISDLSTGAIPGISLDGLGPGGAASLPTSALQDATFGELLDDWRRIFSETFAGFLLSNFAFAMAGGGGAFSKLKTGMSEYSWGTEGGAPTIPDDSVSPIPNSNMPNIPTWDPSAVQLPPPECSISADIAEVTGVGWQTIATMPKEWWQASIDGSGMDSVVNFPDFAAIKTALDGVVDDGSGYVEDLKGIVEDLQNFDFSAGFNPCELFELITSAVESLETNFEFNPEAGTFDIGGSYDLHIADVMIPTAVFRPSVGCGDVYQLHGIPDFGLGGMSLPLPIAGPNGDETFDIFDMDELLRKIPEIPNVPNFMENIPSVPDVPGGIDLSVLCDKPDLFNFLTDVLTLNVPDVQGALASFDGIIKQLTSLDAGLPGTAPGIQARKIMVSLFKVIVEKAGFDSMINDLSDTLKDAMDAGTLTVEMIQEIPPIQAKIDMLMTSMPEMPTISSPSLGGFGSGGGGFSGGSIGGGMGAIGIGGMSGGGRSDAPQIEAAPSQMPGVGMPGGSPGGGMTTGGGIAAMQSKFTIPTITLPDNIPTGDLMGAMFSGMQQSVRSSIESAIVEAGKSVLRSLLDSASEGDFGDFDIMDMLNNALGAANAANAVCEIFTNAGIDCDGNYTETTTSQIFTDTVITIEQGCGEPYEIDTTMPPCNPIEFLGICGESLTSDEAGAWMEGLIGASACARIQEVIGARCPTYALVFDDCQKIADVGEAIGALVPPALLNRYQKPSIVPLRDLKQICCAEPVRDRVKQLVGAGMDLETAQEMADEETANKITMLEKFAADKIQLPEGWPFNGDGHGDTVVPKVYGDGECLDSCPEEPAVAGLQPAKSDALMPPDNEIPTLHFMNEMATDLMFEPTRLAFRLETDYYPELLISGTVSNVAVPFWDTDHDESAISRFAEQLWNGGSMLCDENGNLYSDNADPIEVVRAVLGGAEDEDYAVGEDGGIKFKDIHVLQQQNSGSVAPILYQSLQDFDYLTSTWDTDEQTYAWYFQYGGSAQSPLGEWPKITWQLNPVNQAKLSASIETGEAMKDSATTAVPSTHQTPFGEPCGEYAVTVEEAMEQADASTLEEGLPLKYQLFREFVKNKFIEHPRLNDGVDVPSIESWNNLGLGEKGAGLGHGYKEMYRQSINQIIQSAGIQLTFTDLFNADALKLVQIEPNIASQLDGACGEPPKSVLDLEESGKQPTKDAFMKACKDPAKEAETGKNAFKQSGLVGAINITVRAYIIDHMLRSIFPMSEYDLIDFDSIFVQQIAEKINTEMTILDPQYHAAFMEELKNLFVSMCKAAQCNDEPLVDPLTGEEIDWGDCDSVDPLLYMINKHLKDVAATLDKRFGTSAPNMSKQAQEKWLTTLPLPEYPITEDLDVSGMLKQADLYATLMNNPRPEILLDGFETYYDLSSLLPDVGGGDGDGDGDESDDGSLFYTSLDLGYVNPGAHISVDFPDNIPAPRLFTFSKTNYSSTDLEYVGKDVVLRDGTEEEEGDGTPDIPVETTTLTAQWEQVSDPVASFLEENPYNNLYYSLTSNWQAPSTAEPDEFGATTTVKGGLYLEKFIKIGDEYWNADNLQDWFTKLIDNAGTGDATSIAALAAYAIQEAHYGLRLCYMFPGGTAENLDLFVLLSSMFGTSYGITPDISKMQGSFLQLEGVNFNAEVETTVEVPSSSGGDSDTDSETATDDDSTSTAREITISAVDTHQAQFFNLSIPLAETTISAGSAIVGVLSEMASLDELGTVVDWVANYLEDGSIPDYEDFDAFETPWTNASAALDENMRDLRKSLREEEDWKFIFKQCFFSNEIVQNLWSYCAMMTSVSVPGIDGAFSETKEELRKLFWVLYHDIGTGGDGFSYVPESTSMEVATISTDSSPSSPPLPVKMAMMTIPLLFKGIAETIDPNIMIAKLIRTAADGDQGKIGKFPSTLMALPFNLIPPPPFGPGIGPPITPIGLAYLALGALTPAEKEKMRKQQVANPPPSPDDTGTDADCNPDEGEAD